MRLTITTVIDIDVPPTDTKGTMKGIEEIVRGFIGDELPYCLYHETGIVVEGMRTESVEVEA